MKNLVLLLALVGLAFTFGGCSTNAACGGIAANCCQTWDVYEECDLIEGRRAMCCGAELGCEPGVIVTRETPARSVEVIVEDEMIIEQMPAPEVNVIEEVGN